MHNECTTETRNAPQAGTNLAPTCARGPQRDGRYKGPDGKVVGILRRDGYLRKQLEVARHQLYRPPAWALDFAMLSAISAQGLGQARGVEIHDDQGAVWRADIPTIWRHGFALDRGHGKQWALPLAHWTKTATAPPDVSQEALF